MANADFPFIEHRPFLPFHKSEGSTEPSKAIRIAITERILKDLPPTRREDLDRQITHSADEREGGKHEIYVCEDSPKTHGADGFIWRIGVQVSKAPEGSDLPELRQIGYVRTTETIEESMYTE